MTLTVAAALAAVLALALLQGVMAMAETMATTIATGALTPRLAVLLMAVLSGVGAALGAVAVIGPSPLDLSAWVNGAAPLALGGAGLLVVAVACATTVGWLLLLWAWGMPASATQAVFAGLLGGSLAAGGRPAVGVVLVDVILPPIAVGIVAFVVARVLAAGLAHVLRGVDRTTTGRSLRSAQAVAAGATALVSGAVNGTKVAALVVATVELGGAGLSGLGGPGGATSLVAACLAAGCFGGGWNIVRTLATRITTIDPVGGLAAQGAAALVGTVMGLGAGVSVSGSHTIVSAVVGSGRRAGVSWPVVGRVVVVGLMTPVVVAAVSAALTLLLTRT